MRPSMLPVYINEKVCPIGIDPDALLHAGGPSWNYFQFYRLEVGDYAWHGKLSEYTRSGSLEVNPDIAEALQLSNGDEVTIGISSADPVKRVEYEIAGNADPPCRICEGMEIHEGEIWLFRGKPIKITSCTSGYVTPHTIFKRVDGQQDPGKAGVTTLDDDTTNEKAGFARLTGRQPAIEEIQQKILLGIQQPEFASQYDVNPVSATLLLGPEGVGKKTVVKALGEELGWQTRWIRPNDLFEPAALENKFKEAKAVGEDLLMVIEGLDQLRSSDAAERRAICTIRQFLESTKDDNHILAIGLAKDHQNIAPKLKGVGGFKLHIGLPKPNRTQRAALFQEYLSGVVKDESAVDYLALADQSEGYTGKDIQRVTSQVKLQAMIDATTSATNPPITTPTILEVLSTANQNSHLINNN